MAAPMTLEECEAFLEEGIAAVEETLTHTHPRDDPSPMLLVRCPAEPHSLIEFDGHEWLSGDLPKDMLAFRVFPAVAREKQARALLWISCAWALEYTAEERQRFKQSGLSTRQAAMKDRLREHDLPTTDDVARRVEVIQLTLVAPGCEGAVMGFVVRSDEAPRVKWESHRVIQAGQGLIEGRFPEGMRRALGVSTEEET